MKMLKTKTLTLLAATILLIVLVTLLSFNDREASRMSISDMNDIMSVVQIKYGMSEDEVILLWGKGEYQEGFGGHYRKYTDHQIELGFSGDRDNDLYGKVSAVTFTNPVFSVLGIHVGDVNTEAAAKLIDYGFKTEGELYFRDEFFIDLRGDTTVNEIHIDFEDKDLRGRVY